MPKQVDHDQRRREVAEAVWRLAAREGLEVVSLGAVAREAGVSKGRVQHYFASRDELLDVTAALLRTRIEQRLQRRIAEDRPQTPLETLRTLLAALLPTGPDSRTEALVSTAFFIRALNRPSAAAAFHSGRSQIRDLIAGLLRDTSEARALHPDVAPAVEADILLALVGGLADAVLIGEHDADSAMTVLDHQLARLGAKPNLGAGI